MLVQCSQLAIKMTYVPQQPWHLYPCAAKAWVTLQVQDLPFVNRPSIRITPTIPQMENLKIQLKRKSLGQYPDCKNWKFSIKIWTFLSQKERNDQPSEFKPKWYLSTQKISTSHQFQKREKWNAQDPDKKCLWANNGGYNLFRGQTQDTSQHKNYEQNQTPIIKTLRSTK
jgi:hypothetical protein